MIRKRFNFWILVFIVFPLVLSGSDLKDILSGLPFGMPVLQAPEFPERTVNIKEAGGVPGGEVLNTNVFNSTIATISIKGGGVVLVPAGIWLTGPIVFKSNVNLHLESGAVIIFSDNIEDYSLLNSTWEGLEDIRYQAPIFGKDLENIAITGNGIIDGSGDAWRPVKKSKLTERQWDNLVATGGKVDDNVWWPSEKASNGARILRKLKDNHEENLEAYKTAGEYLRPVMINFVGCKNILLDGPTFQNSPAWNIHPLLSENIIIRNVTVRNPWYSQNGDGLDLESCKNVALYNSSFDVGDDAICLKSGRDEYGRQRGRATENIVIDNCVVYHGHGGFTVGSEMSGGIRNISVRNCTFLGTDVGLRFKSTRGRGGIVENIYIENINMIDIPMEAIRFNMFYNNSPPIPEDGEEGIIAFADRPAVEVSEETPIFRKIEIKNIRCTNAGQAVLLQGLPEMALKEMNLDGIFINAHKGLVCVDGDDITLKDIRIKTETGPSLAFYNSTHIIVENTSVAHSKSPFASIFGKKSSQIEFRGMDVTRDKNTLQIGQEVDSDSIHWY